MNVIFVLVGFFVGFLLTRSVFGGIGGIFAALLFKTLYFDKKFPNKVAKPTKIYSPADFEFTFSLCIGYQGRWCGFSSRIRLCKT